MRAFKSQIGQYFLVIGVIMLAVFFVTDQSQNPQFLLFFGGLVVGGFGFFLMWGSRSSRTDESARFRSVRRYRQKSRERREMKRQKEQDRRDQRQHERRGRRRQEKRNQQQQEQYSQQQEQRERQS